MSLEEEIGSLKEEITFLIVGAENYGNVIIELLKILISKQFFCIYLTVNKPYETLISWLEKNNIQTDKLFFIDVTGSGGGTSERLTEKCLFLPSSEDLTCISIELIQAVEALKVERKVILFDSFSTFLIYNPLENMLKFIHFLIGRIRMLRVSLIILSLKEQTDVTTISQMTQFCDRVVKI